MKFPLVKQKKICKNAPQKPVLNYISSKRLESPGNSVFRRHSAPQKSEQESRHPVGNDSNAGGSP